MKAEQIYAAIGEVDEQLLVRCEQKRRPTWVKWIAVAVCLCAVTLGVYALGRPLSEVPGKNGEIIFSAASQQLGSIYAPPGNGETLIFTELKEAMDDHTGEEVIYFVAVDIFRDGAVLEATGNEAQEEVKRLQDKGYRMGLAESWTYQGEEMEQVTFSYLAGYFTKEQLEKFDGSADYGYAFSFAVNGDGTAVSPDEHF